MLAASPELSGGEPGALAPVPAGQSLGAAAERDCSSFLEAQTVTGSGLKRRGGVPGALGMGLGGLLRHGLDPDE